MFYIHKYFVCYFMVIIIFMGHVPSWELSFGLFVAVFDV